MYRQRTDRRIDRLPASREDLQETQVVTILVLTDRFEDAGELRSAFFLCFPEASEDEFMDACRMALQVLSPEGALH